MRISDWSSDVCSSDLLMELIERRLQIMAVERLASALHVPALSCRTSCRLPAPADRAARNNLANWFIFLRVLVAVRLTNPAPGRQQGSTPSRGSCQLVAPMARFGLGSSGRSRHRAAVSLEPIWRPGGQQDAAENWEQTTMERMDHTLSRLRELITSDGVGRGGRIPPEIGRAHV